MSRLFCGECMCIVNEPHKWIEPHGEPRCGCQCGNSLTEIDPCKICGNYPEDEYEDGRLENFICKECFENGITEHFLEYLNDLEIDEQIKFYFGKCTGGYVYDSFDILLILRDDYADRVKIHQKIFGEERGLSIWRQFINDGDSGHFADWLIKKKER